MKLREFFRDYYEPMRLRSCSPRSSELHSMCHTSFERFLGREALLSDLNDLTVSRYLKWYRQGRAAFSVERHRESLLALWRYAFRKKLIADWPDVPAETLPRNTPTAWTTDEIQRLLKACSKVEGHFERIPHSVFWTCIILVVWDTGERIGAVRSLLWTDIDLKAGWINFRAETRKGGRQSKTHQLSAATIDALKMMKLDARRDEVFFFPLDPPYFYGKFKKVTQLAGLDEKRQKFHKIRRSVASYYEAAGGDATELLGHSARSITKKHYLDPRITKETKPACDLIPKVNNSITRDAGKVNRVNADGNAARTEAKGGADHA